MGDDKKRKEHASSIVQDLSITDEKAFRDAFSQTQDTEDTTLQENLEYSDHTRQLPQGTILGRYVVQQKIGSGGMSVIYRAYDPDLERIIAIKILHINRKNLELARDRLLREAHILAQLSHPNVIMVYDVGAFDDGLFVAMELAPGLSLNQWVKENKPDWRQTLKILLDAGQGLAAAHAAGIIHRDFKPDNIIVGHDGRVRVLDFGISIASADCVNPNDELQETKPYTTLPENADPLTSKSKLIGTFGYMAPEQYGESKGDEKSDQFSFCVTLFRALYGMRPFDGRTKRELMDKTLEGIPQKPPDDTLVPSGIHKIILKGLATDPEQRYPSMKELIADLKNQPRLTFRKMAVLIILGLLSIVGLVFFLARSSDDPPCMETGSRLKGIWDADIKNDIRNSFKASGRLTADETYFITESILNRYIEKWKGTAVDTCEATYVRKNQSIKIFDLRMHCLDRRLNEFRSLTRLFSADSGKDIVDRAIQAVSSLPGIDVCSDVESLTVKVPLPTDPSTLDRVKKLQLRLDDASALLRAGKYSKGVDIAGKVVEASRQLAYKPVLAQSLQLFGWLQARSGDLTNAEQNLREACTVAGEIGDNEMLARSSLRLQYLVGNLESRISEALDSVPLVDALVVRAGNDPKIKARFLCDTGLLLLHSGEKDVALAHFTQARKLLESALGPKHPDVAHTLNLVANVKVEQGDFAGAQKTLEQALLIWQQTLGMSHPKVAIAMNNLGDVLTRQGRLKEARKYFEQALSIYEKMLGRNHTKVGIALANLADVDLKQSKFKKALPIFRRALRIFDQNLDNAHPLLAYPLTGMGICLLQEQDSTQASSLLDRAWSIRNNNKTDPWLKARTLFYLAKAKWNTGLDQKQALSLAKKAKALYAKARISAAKEKNLVDNWLNEHLGKVNQ